MTDDTEKARQYAFTPLGIRPAEYGAFLDGRLSLRKEMDALQARVRELENRDREWEMREDLLKKENAHRDPGHNKLCTCQYQGQHLACPIHYGAQ